MITHHTRQDAQKHVAATNCEKHAEAFRTSAVIYLDIIATWQLQEQQEMDI